MELRQLAYFDAVVRHRNFTRAAEALHVAQPAVSAQIRRLEAELGVTLLRRTTRRVGLTEAGERLWVRVGRILDEVAGARAELEELAQVVTGRVRVGAIQALDLFDLPGALAAFHTRYPGVELSLRSGPGRFLLDGLAADELDLGLGPMPPDLPDTVAAELLFTDELVIVTAPGHRLGRQAGVALSELRDDPFICLPAESGLRRILDDAASRAGFTAQVPFEHTNLVHIRELVGGGLGVALLARSVAEAPGRPVVIHSVEPEPIQRPVGLLHRLDRRLSPAAEACRRLLLDWSPVRAGSA